MNNRSRLLVALASMLPLTLGLLVCGVLLAAGTVSTGVVSALAIAVVVQGVFTFIRLRRTTGRPGVTSVDS
ncbi:hypothetical protein [Nocardia jejuensis]|uniref:hypothetical protein n=1 Tax=Nocardia jejuensis TaxID=328049 RepID=UPI00082E5A5B|nr:hypothetical protein [Nocardia jejuensis]